MPKSRSPTWAQYLNDHVRATNQTWGEIARALGVTEGTIRHWRNGTRDIGLKEFLQLCQQAGADPAMILMDLAKDQFLSQLIFFYDGIKSQERRDQLIGRANALYVEEHPAPSRAAPFGGAVITRRPTKRLN